MVCGMQSISKTLDLDLDQSYLPPENLVTSFSCLNCFGSCNRTAMTFPPKRAPFIMFKACAAKQNTRVRLRQRIRWIATRLDQESGTKRIRIHDSALSPIA